MNLSKESKIKKRLKKASQEKSETNHNSVPQGKKVLSDDEKARIIRDRLANRPVIVFRYPNGKYNKRFIFTMALMVAALIAALYFITRF